jgi:hypothetical protein
MKKLRFKTEIRVDVTVFVSFLDILLNPLPLPMASNFIISTFTITKSKPQIFEVNQIPSDTRILTVTAHTPKVTTFPETTISKRLHYDHQGTGIQLIVITRKSILTKK